MKTETLVAGKPGTGAPAKRILCAVDFSKYSEAALLSARLLAQRWGAPLEVVCATDLPGFLILPEDTEAGRSRLDAFRRQVQDRLNAFVGNQHDIPCWAWDGPADEAVVAAAKEREADLIVLGTHGRSGIPRLALGSISESVIARAKSPVLVVHGRQDPGWPKKVLAPVKFTEYSDRALVYAGRFAASVGAGLGVVHVVEPGMGATRRSIEGMNEHVDRVLAGQSFEFSARESKFEVGEAILREAEAGGYDLIVMAAHRKPFWRDWTFGMTVQRLLRYATLPILAVPTGPAA